MKDNQELTDRITIEPLPSCGLNHNDEPNHRLHLNGYFQCCDARQCPYKSLIEGKPSCTYREE